MGAFGEKFSILQFVGFLILISGTLVYNVIFRVPTFGTRRALALACFVYV
eukprot:SAG25_NODE_7555_length_473_cov_0.933155_1_plen_50_part_00